MLVYLEIQMAKMSTYWLNSANAFCLNSKGCTNDELAFDLRFEMESSGTYQMTYSVEKHLSKLVWVTGATWESETYREATLEIAGMAIARVVTGIVIIVDTCVVAKTVGIFMIVDTCVVARIVKILRGMVVIGFSVVLWSIPIFSYAIGVVAERTRIIAAIEWRSRTGASNHFEKVWFWDCCRIDCVLHPDDEK